MRLFKPLVGVAFLALFVSLGLTQTSVAMEAENPIDGTRAALEKWVETRRIISKEKRDWDEGQQLLKDRIELVQREITSLQTRTGDANKSLAEADKRRDELFGENQELKAAGGSYSSTAIALEGKLLSLLKRLPDPLLERVKSLSQRVPAEPTSTKLSLSERYLNIVGILNEIDRFNGEISVQSEIHELPDGSTAEVAVMYVGLGHAYYVTNNGKHAGVGTATANSWIWEPDDEAASNIQKAIGILKNEISAQYVQLPLKLN